MGKPGGPGKEREAPEAPATPARPGPARVKSMTGYGAAAFALGGRRYEVAVRSVNHRFLDLKLFLPRFCDPLEPDIGRVVRERLSRGHVELTLRPLGGEAPGLLAVTPDLSAAKAIYEALDRIAGAIGISEPPTLSQVASFREIFSFSEQRPELDELRDDILGAIRSALDSVEEMRAKEGLALAEELSARARSIREICAVLERRAPESISQKQRRLETRIRSLLSEVSKAGLEPGILEARVALEAALLADKSDVAEEVARLRSHLDQLEAMLSEGGPQGRRLDFLVQELNREANTTGSKIQDSELARLVVDLKAEIERMREQVQNIE